MTRANHYEQIQYGERVAIASYQSQGLSIRAMARILNRAASSKSAGKSHVTLPLASTAALLPNNAATAGAYTAARSLNCTSPTPCLPKSANF